MQRRKILIGLLIVLSMVTLLQLLVLEYFNPSKYNLREIIISPVGSFTTGVILLFLLVVPFFDFSAKFKIKQRLIYLFLFSFVYCISYIIVVFLFPLIFLQKTFYEYESYVINFAVSDFHNVLKNYLFQIAILFAFEYILNQEKLLLAKKDLEVELNKTKLEMLKSQLQPHFLFNALNNVVALIDENKAKAQKTLIELSDLLRYSINLEPSELVSIYEEIEISKKYITVEQSKFEEQLHVSWLIDGNLKSFKLPPLTIQPLVENAIKHGFVNNANILNVKISVKDGIIEVKNNGQPLNSTPLKGNGINLVEKRLSAHFGKNFNFTIKQMNDWVINTITIHDFL